MSTVEIERAIDQRRLEETVARAAVIAAGAFAAASSWRERVRAAVQTLLAFLDDEPVAASVLLVDGLGDGRNALTYQTRVLDTLSAVLDEGRREASAEHEALPFSAESVVLGVLDVLHVRVLEGTGSGSLLELANPLMATLVFPYFGLAAALEELGRPAVDVQRTW